MAYTIRDPDLERLLIALAEVHREPRVELIRRWAAHEMEELRRELGEGDPS